MPIIIGPMAPADWPRVRAIYLEGIATGQATFEVEAPTWEQWDAAHHAFGRLVARATPPAPPSQGGEEGIGSQGGEEIVAWAALSPVSPRGCYAGVAETSVYVGARHRGRGLGRELLCALIAESERHGIWTLQGATFADNEASLRLQRACGFREVGRRERIGQLRGVWRDTILMERRSLLVGSSS
jgi:phosphinothricin acetyltransferase